MIIDGKKEAALLREEIKKEVLSLKEKYNKTPGLTVILIGEFAPSQIYVKNKEKNSKEVGMNSNVVKYPSNVTEKEVLEKIKKLNQDDSVSGILVQLPLPEQINKEKIINAIDPKKDVDGFHPVNVGNLASGYNAIVPCTPLGCLYLIKKTEKNLSGKHAVILGRSNLNGKPMAQLLLKENCTVTIVHSKTKDLKQECLKADILVAAVGVAKLVKEDWVKKNSIVIDVGINKAGDKVVGDVDFDAVKKALRFDKIPMTPPKIVVEDERMKKLTPRQRQALARVQAKPKSQVSLPKMPDFMKLKKEENEMDIVDTIRNVVEKKLDPVNKDAVKKKFDDRKDKDIDNDGDVDSSDKFLHKKRKAISKAIGKNEDASEIKYDARSKSFKETLRRLGYVKEKSLIYNNKKSGKK